MHRNVTPAAPLGLPALDSASSAHAVTVARFLADRIRHRPGAFMPFEEWMQLALYAPGLGYYAAGSAKFGGARPEGDFTTAPELSPLFGATLARQAFEILRQTGTVSVLEFGAGSGALATAIIPALRDLGIEPDYQILEVSADLRHRQRQRLEAFGSTVRWLDALPSAFRGCVIANEVLDAMPATLFQWSDTGELEEVGVTLQDESASSQRPPIHGAEATASPDAMHVSEASAAGIGQPRFCKAYRPASPDLHAAVSRRMPPLPGYRSEVNLQAEAWIRQMGDWLQEGAALLIDYGFPQREYYHPQRAEGTLMCHFRHHAHADALIHPGLQDITAHVDFTAMADAALEAGLDVLGYTSQARFLMNAGLPELMAGDAAQAAGPSQGDGADAVRRMQHLAAVQNLLSEAEMGELFKVLAIGRGVRAPLLGFSRGDRRDRL